MKKCCYTPSYTQFKTYGKKGYRVWPAWKDDFIAFLNDMGPIPSGCKGIRLIDHSIKVFGPGNCAWTKGGRGRPRKTLPFPSSRKNFKQPVKIYLTVEKPYLEAIKSCADRMSNEIGHVVEPNDVVRDVIRRAFPINEQMEMFKP